MIMLRGRRYSATSGYALPLSYFSKPLLARLDWNAQYSDGLCS